MGCRRSRQDQVWLIYRSDFSTCSNWAQNSFSHYFLIDKCNHFSIKSPYIKGPFLPFLSLFFWFFADHFLNYLEPLKHFCSNSGQFNHFLVKWNKVFNKVYIDHFRPKIVQIVVSFLIMHDFWNISGRYGVITSKTLKVSYSWLIQMIVNVLVRPGTN